MKKGKTLQRMFGVSLLAMMFGAGSAYAQLGQENSAGKTPRNQENKMSITGQNATSSAAPPKLDSESASGASTTSGSSASGSSASGSAPLGQENSAGETPRNKENKMSITGQNATSSASPPTTSGASGVAGGAAAGSSSAMESKSSGSSATSSSASKGGGAISQSDQNMMKQLAYTNMAEIEAAQMAMDKSQDQQVKTFAQKMIDDHTKAHEKLRELADAKDVKLPKELDAKHKKEVQNLSKLSGDKFDKKYLSQGGVTDHRDAQKLLSRIEKRAKDDQLKTLASTLMPTIDEHWKMAKEMKAADAGTKPPATGSSSTKSMGASGSAATSGAEKSESK